MAEAPPKVRIVAPQEGETLNVLGANVRVKLGGDRPSLFLADHPVPPGYGVPMHMHDDEDESFFVLEGEVTFESVEGIAHVGPGGFVHAPRGSRHSFRNESGRPARMLCLGSAGGGLNAMFHDFDRAAAMRGTAGAPGVLDPQTIGAIAAEHGIHIV